MKQRPDDHCSKRHGFHWARSQRLHSLPFLERWTTAVSTFRTSRNISNNSSFIDHWQDVLTGSILGTVTSYFAYRQYYPSLSDERSHQPYSPRIKRDEDHDIPMHYQPTSRNSSPRHSGQDANGHDQMTVVPEDTVPRPELEAPWKARSSGPSDDYLSSSEVPKEMA